MPFSRKHKEKKGWKKERDEQKNGKNKKKTDGSENEPPEELFLADETR